MPVGRGTFEAGSGSQYSEEEGMVGVGEAEVSLQDGKMVSASTHKI